MPAIETTPPADGTYSFVLRRYDRYLQEHAIAFVCYTGQYDSCWIEIDGEGAHTLFLQSKEERDLAAKTGWKDETDRWFAGQRRRSLVAAVGKALASLASPSVASAVAKTAGYPTAEVEVVLLDLERRGEAVARGTGAIRLWSAPIPLKAAKPEGAQAGA